METLRSGSEGPRVGIVVCALGALLVFTTPSRAQRRFSFEGSLGGAWNLETTLTIRQEGRPDIRLNAGYESRSLEFPLYYLLRVGYHQETGAWEVQFTHHKVYLVRSTHEVQHFEITHGYNLFTLNRSFSSLPVTLRLGGGFVLAHPENEVRGEKLVGEYTLTGPALLVAVGKPFDVSPWLFLNAEAQFTYARAKVPVADGAAMAPNAALHGLVGVGFRF